MKPILSFIVLILCLFQVSHGQKQMSYDQPIPGTSIQFRLILVPGGVVEMGSKQEKDEMPVTSVEVSPFFIAEHEVTFEEWDAYFKDTQLPQSKQIDGVTRATPQYIDLTWGMGREPNHPANSMSHQAAMMYCYWLFKKTRIFFRLPTEAEWEYACKAGEAGIPPPQDLNGVAWFAGNSGNKFHPVKEKKSNALGLYDMLGNLSEWTLDQYDANYFSSIQKKDPIVLPGSRYPKTVRGGSYLDPPGELRCSNRIASQAQWNQRDPQIPKSRWWLTDGMFVGFRVVRPFAQPPAEEIENFFKAYWR